MATESELSRVHMIRSLESAIEAARAFADYKCKYEIEIALLIAEKLLEERITNMNIQKDTHHEHL